MRRQRGASCGVSVIFGLRSEAAGIFPVTRVDVIANENAARFESADCMRADKAAHGAADGHDFEALVVGAVPVASGRGDCLAAVLADRGNGADLELGELHCVMLSPLNGNALS